MLQTTPWEWRGDLPEAAHTILHQHMIQGDLTDLQVSALRWRALFNKAKEVQINFRVLYEALRDVEERWQKDLLSTAEVGEILAKNCISKLCGHSKITASVLQIFFFLLHFFSPVYT